VEVALQVIDAEMEHASAIPIVITKIVVMMVVEDLVELVKVELFAKDPLILILNYVTTIVTLI